MDPAAFVARIRDHFVDQFRTFVRQQKEACSEGAAEVKLQLHEESALFDKLYCVDFLRNEGSPQVVEFQPPAVLSFAPITGRFGELALTIETLHWDDVVLQHDLPDVDPAILSPWFRRWFDPDDTRHDAAAELCGVIHSLLVGRSTISVDFGSADPVSFWDMLQLLDDAGATRVTVTQGRGT